MKASLFNTIILVFFIAFTSAVSANTGTTLTSNAWCSVDQDIEAIVKMEFFVDGVMGFSIEKDNKVLVQSKVKWSFDGTVLALVSDDDAVDTLEVTFTDDKLILNSARESLANDGTTIFSDIEFDKCF